MTIICIMTFGVTIICMDAVTQKSVDYLYRHSYRFRRYIDRKVKVVSEE